MRNGLVLLVLLLVPLSGCLDDLPETPVEEAPDMEPAQDGFAPDGFLYLHADGDRLWMDAEPTTTDVLSGTISAAREDTYVFPLEPAPERDVVHAGPVVVALDLRVGGAVGAFPHVSFALLVDDEVVDEAEGTQDGARLDSPTWPAGADVALRVCLCTGPGTVAYNYELHTGEDSTVALDTASPDDPAAAPQEPGSTGSAGRPSGPSDSSQQTGDVTVERQGDRFVARRTDTFTSTVAADRATVDLITFNGDVDVRPDGADSHLQARLFAWGDTEQQARDRLAEMAFEYGADDGSVFDLDVRLVAPDRSSRGASLALALPAVHLDRLVIDSSNGALSVEGFNGGDWNLDSSNGGVSVDDASLDTLAIDTSNGHVRVTDATLDELVIDSSNAGVDLEAVVDDLTVDSSNGAIDATLRARGSGHWLLDTSNARIELRVPEDAQRGYDLVGETSNAQVTFDFRGTEEVGPQSNTGRHERTRDFDSRTIQTTVVLDSSNASIDAEGT